MLEDEVGDVMQEKLDLQSEHEQDRERLAAAQRELERQAQRGRIQPVGVQELKDQLDISNDVRQQLCDDIARLTEDLVHAKLMHAQEMEQAEELRHKLLRAGTKQRALALRMTELEVQLVQAEDEVAKNDELKAGAFMEALQQQVDPCPRRHAALPVPSLPLPSPT